MGNNTATLEVDARSITNHQANTEEVNKIINNYTLYASGAGLIPIPVLDIAAVTGVQLKMLHELAKKYNYTFSEHAMKSAIGIVVTAIPGSAIVKASSSLFKFIPLVGHILVGVNGLLYAAASTYALGKVFSAHFASGMTLLSFSPEKMKAAYKEHFEDYAKHNAAPSKALVDVEIPPVKPTKATA